MTKCDPVPPHHASGCLAFGCRCCIFALHFETARRLRSEARERRDYVAEEEADERMNVLVVEHTKWAFREPK